MIALRNRETSGCASIVEAALILAFISYAAPANAAGCPAGFTWQGGALCAAYNMAPGACAAQGGRFVQPKIPGAPTRCEVAAGPSTAAPDRTQPPPPVAVPAPPPPATASPPSSRYSRVECEAHFASLPTMDARTWDSIQKDTPRYAEQQQQWADYRARRDAVGNACIAAFPGLYEAKQAQAWVRPPAGEPFTRTIDVPAECRYVFSSVVLRRDQSGDFTLDVTSVDGYSFSAGYLSTFNLDGRSSESVEAKLRYACDSYRANTTGLRSVVYIILRNIGPYKKVAVSGIPKGTTGRGPGTLEACANFDSSIQNGRRALSTLESNKSTGQRKIELEMCRLAESVMDELVNISGADCPPKLPELRSVASAIAKHRCAAHRTAYLEQCWERQAGNQYCYTGSDGKRICSICVLDGGRRG